MKVILYAMKPEVVGITQHLKKTRPIANSWTNGIQGEFHGEELLLVQTGVGKVLASMTAQYVIGQFHPSTLILTGLSGAINPAMKQGDLIIGRDFIQHDVSAEEFGFKKGQIPYTDYQIIAAPEELRARARQVQLEDAAVHEGRILSGDQFISGGVGRKLRDEFAGDAVDMESAAVALVCYLNKVPFVVGRTISDAADEDAKSRFEEFLQVASRHVVRFVEAMM